jgi:ankyrin repeat protein
LRALTSVTAFPRNLQDGLAAVHWAAIKGHKEVLKFLIEGAPENNRADPLIVDKDNWSALMWAIFMAESAGKGDNLAYARSRPHLNAIHLKRFRPDHGTTFVSAEIGKRKSQCEIVNYLMASEKLRDDMEEMLNKADRLLHK